MWNLENGMDDLIGKAETETHQMDTKGKGGGMNRGTGIGTTIDTHYWCYVWNK